MRLDMQYTSRRLAFNFDIAKDADAEPSYCIFYTLRRTRDNKDDFFILK